MSVTYVYVSSILLAFLSSLISFRLDLSYPLKLFSCLLGLTFLVELAAAVMEYTHISNFWLYNTFALLEFWIYGYYYMQLIRSPVVKRSLRIFLKVFPIFWTITLVVVFQLKTWNSYGIVAGSFFTVLFVLSYYADIIGDMSIRHLRTLPEFWIATGMLIFYLAAIPFFGALNFLVKYHLEASKILAKLIMMLDTLMYLFFTYAFLCKMINIKKS